MEKIRFAMTGLDVSPLALGTWQLGGDWGDFDERSSGSGTVPVAGPSPESV